MSTCSTCGAPITWARTEKGDKSIPLDPAPAANGNLVLGDGGVRAHLPLFDPPDIPRYVSHFATCPDADQHRRTR